VVIVELRRQIAGVVGTLLLFLSFGLLKPNLTGLPTVENPGNSSDQAAVGLHVDDEPPPSN